MCQTMSAMEYKFELPNKKLDSKSRKTGYPIDAIQNIRSHLINDFYIESTWSLCEMNLKRKLGTLTDEVVDFYLNKKKPKQFNEDPNFFNTWSEKIVAFEDNLKVGNKITEFEKDYEFDIDDLAIPEKTDIANNRSKPFKTTTSISIQPILGHVVLTPDSLHGSISQLSSSSSISSSLSLHQQVDPKREESDIKILNKDLNMEHGCQKDCSKYVPVLNQNIELKNLNLDSYFICDFCHYTSMHDTSIRCHLKDTGHQSASEYLVEKNGNKNGSNDLLANLNATYTLKYLKNRFGILNQTQKNSNSYQDFGVFCSKCHSFFDKNVLAASLHFKYSHRLNEMIYSIGRLIEKLDIEIRKTQECVQCHIKFKKFGDLIGHIEKSKHFPCTKPNQINVFCCPFDDCPFKCTDYFPFKNHMMNHSYFNRQIKSLDDEPRVIAKVLVYNVPVNYYHLTLLDDSQKKEKILELEAINYLLEMTKNNLTLKGKLSARKDEILKSIN